MPSLGRLVIKLTRLVFDRRWDELGHGGHTYTPRNINDKSTKSALGVSPSVGEEH